jgi:DGQHR domain-containing protein
MQNSTFTGQVVRQRGKILFVGSMPVKELLKIYKIDIWKITDPIEKRGIQRSPIPAHFRKIGKSLTNPNVSFPTAVVLSSDLANDSKGSEVFEGITLPKGMRIRTVDTENDLVNIEIDSEQLKLQVVDGQHRIRGIEFALEKGILSPDETFNLPYVLILAQDRYEEIQNFYSINSKAKRVATDLALQLMNEMEESDPRYHLSLPEKKKVIAVNIANTLNEDGSSVWYGNISQGNISTKDEIISSTSFVTSILPILTIPFFNEEIKNLGSGNSDIQDYGHDKAKIINNFWDALKRIMPSVFDEKTDWVIQKTPGVYILHKVFSQVLNEYFIQKGKGDLGVDAIEEFFRDYGSSYLSSEEIDFWRAAKGGTPGGEASTANSSQAFKRLSDNILEDIKAKYDEGNHFNLRY